MDPTTNSTDARLHALTDAIEHLPATTMVEVGWIRHLIGVAADAPEAELIDVPAIAKMLDRSPSTARELCASGAIPNAFRLRGREWRASPDDVRAFLDSERERHVRASRPEPVVRRGRPKPLDSWRKVAGA